jgi:type II secretory pathway pseudopilin PulG
MKLTAQSGFAGMRNTQTGFSLFELVVYLLIASILFSAALNRYREFPGEAERANFIAVLAQLKAGVNLQMMSAIASGGRAEVSALTGTNPMSLMLQTPSNYVGEFSVIDETTMPRRVWYFDIVRGELVYLAENANNLYVTRNGQTVSGNQIRLRIENAYGGATGTDWQGTMLSAVEPYEWQSVPLELTAAQ